MNYSAMAISVVYTNPDVSLISSDATMYSSYMSGLSLKEPTTVAPSMSKFLLMPSMLQAFGVRRPGAVFPFHQSLLHTNEICVSVGQKCIPAEKCHGFDTPDEEDEEEGKNDTEEKSILTT